MENQVNYSSPEEAIDIRKFIYKILNKWYWFVISLTIAYIVAYFINYYADPVYSVSATLLINDEKKSAAEVLISSIDRLSARKNIDNEIAILKSYKMASKALRELKDFDISYFSVGTIRKPMQYKSAPFYIVVDSGSYNLKEYPVEITILSKDEYKLEIDGKHKISKILKFKERYSDGNFNFKVYIKEPSNTNKYFFIFNDIGSLTNNYRNKLNIATNDKRGTVLTLSTTGLVPQMEADYINKLMEVYIRMGLEEKNQTAINTINFIDNQLSTVVDSLRRAEDKLQIFRLNNKVVDLTTEGSAIKSKLEKVQEDRATAEIQLRYYKYVQDYIQKRKDFKDVIAPAIMGISDALLNSLITELSRLYSERSILIMNAQDDNPSLTLLNAKIQNTMKALQENINEIINSAKISLNEISNQEASIEEELQKLPVTERRLLNIQRDFKLNDQIYNFLLQKRAEAAISKASNVADNKVLDEASAYSTVQIAPLESKNKMVAIVLGLLFPLSILFLLEFFNNKINDVKVIEKLTKVPIFGSVGHNDKSSDIPVADNSKSTIAESFRALRTNLQYILRDKEKKVICMSSTMSGEGKTFCVINLAAILAQAQKKTLLLSLDLRKPKIHKIFNIDNKVGLSTYLIGKTSYEDIIKPTNIDHLYVSVSGPIPPNPSELLDTELMEKFITRAKNEFDFILIDTPPIAIVTDAILLSRYSDANIFVIRHNYSPRDVLYLVDELSNKRNVPNIGILINDVKVNSYYAYGKKYSYNYGYSDIYNDYYSDHKKPTWRQRMIKRIFQGI